MCALITHMLPDVVPAIPVAEAADRGRETRETNSGDIEGLYMLRGFDGRSTPCLDLEPSVQSRALSDTPRIT